MEKTAYRTIEETLNLVGGHHRYQIRILIINSIIQVAGAFFIMGIPYLLAPPKLECIDENCCHISEDSPHNFSSEFNIVCENEHKSALIGTFYFLGSMLGAGILS